MRVSEKQENDKILDFEVPKCEELEIQETKDKTMFCYDDGQYGLSELTLEAYSYEDQIQCTINTSPTKTHPREHDNDGFAFAGLEEAYKWLLETKAKPKEHVPTSREDIPSENDDNDAVLLEKVCKFLIEN